MNLEQAMAHQYTQESESYPQTMVTADSGPRPYGSPIECFFCHQQIGQLHKSGCAIDVQYKTVQLKIFWPDGELEFEDRVQKHWNDEDIVFRFNWSTWCTLNVLDNCLCGHDDVRVEIVRPS